MIVLAIEFHQLGIKVFADASEYQLHRIQVLFLEHVSAVFRNEDQVYM